MAESNSSSSSSSVAATAAEAFRYVGSILAQDTIGVYKERFVKWGLSEKVQVHKFRFDFKEQFDTNDDIAIERFFTGFLESPAFRKHVPVCNKEGKWQRSDIKGHNMKIDRINCTLTSIKPIRTLLMDANVISEDGNIRQCYPEFLDDININDEIRKLLLVDEDNIVNEELKQELLMKIWSHLVIGGNLCQYDDNIEPYFDVARSIYKEICTAMKHVNTGKIVVKNVAFEIKQKNNTSDCAFFHHPRSEQNLCVVSVDMRNRNLFYYYFSY